MTSDAVVGVDLVKTYKRHRALDGFSVSVRSGTCAGIMGPNGAGKSTFTRLLYGRTRRDSGQLSVLGLDPGLHAKRLRSLIGVVTQENFLDSDLNVQDNLAIFGVYHGLPRRAAQRRAAQCLELLGLEDRRHEPVPDLSGGMQRRLALARALVNQPRLLLLDEPTVGLDPLSRLALWEVLESLRSQGVTLVMSTHDMREAEKMCDDIIVIDRGRVLDQAAPENLIDRHQPVDQGAGPASVMGGRNALEDVYVELFASKDEEEQ